METKTLATMQDAFDLFDRIGGGIFSCVFVKRTTGERREMVARRGVKKHLAGGELAFEPRKRSLLPVFDMQKEGYRMVNVETLEEVRHGGVRYVTAWS